MKLRSLQDSFQPHEIVQAGHVKKRAMMALDRSPESFSHKMNSTFLVPIVSTCDP